MVWPLPKVIPLPSKTIGMHAASCDRVVLVLFEQPFNKKHWQWRRKSKERRKKRTVKVTSLLVIAWTAHRLQHCHLHQYQSPNFVENIMICLPYLLEDIIVCLPYLVEIISVYVQYFEENITVCLPYLVDHNCVSLIDRENVIICLPYLVENTIVIVSPIICR